MSGGVYGTAMIAITPSISLDEAEIQESFVRASGPGGQNVNKVETAVQLRFDVRGSPSLPEDVRSRLIHMAGQQVSDDGVLLIRASRFRTQERNRQDVLNRLIALIQAAAKPPKPRRPTRPTLASRQRRLESKRRQSALKSERRATPRRDE